MRHRDLKTAIILLVLSGSRAFGFSYSPITTKALKQKTQAPCAFVQFWAAWCEVCIQEMPKLLPFLEEKKGLEKVVIDLSQGIAHEKFSKPWLQKIAPNSKTYRKGTLHDHDLVESIIPKWNGSLPLSALFSKGKLKVRWNGSVAHDEINQAISKHCK